MQDVIDDIFGIVPELRDDVLDGRYNLTEPSIGFIDIAKWRDLVRPGMDIRMTMESSAERGIEELKWEPTGGINKERDIRATSRAPIAALKWISVDQFYRSRVVSLKTWRAIAKAVTTVSPEKKIQVGVGIFDDDSDAAESIIADRYSVASVLDLNIANVEGLIISTSSKRRGNPHVVAKSEGTTNSIRNSDQDPEVLDIVCAQRVGPGFNVPGTKTTSLELTHTKKGVSATEIQGGMKWM